MSAANGTGGDVATLQLIRAAELAPWPDLNPRRRFDEQKHQELVASIRRGGVHQPLVVHPVQHEYWVIAGERRMRAAKAIGGDTLVPCMVREYSEDEALEIALIENMDRDDLTPIEEARGFKRLLDTGITQKKLAERIGRTQPYISNRIRLLELPDEILTLVEDGKIEVTHARDLLLPFVKIPQAKRKKLFAALAKRAASARDGDVLQRIVADEAIKLSRPISQTGAQWNEKAPEFDARAHAKCTCGGPKFRYSWDPSVRCFDEAWWDAANAKAIEKRRAAEKKAAAAIENSVGAAAAARMDEAAFEKAHGGHRAWNLEITGQLADASLLADAPLVVVKRRHGGLGVYCPDEKALKRARRAVSVEEKRLIEERRATRGAELRTEAEKAGVQPWMLAQILTARPYADSILDVGRELGLDVGKHGEVNSAIHALPKNQLELLFIALSIRTKHDDIGYRDPIPDEVRRQLTKRYTPGITALVKKARKAADRNGATSAPDDIDDGADDSAEAQLLDGRIPIDTSDHDAYCLLCECTDSHACEDGCSWLAVDREAGVGVCSQCAESEEEARETLATAVLA